MQRFMAAFLHIQKTQARRLCYSNTAHIAKAYLEFCDLSLGLKYKHLSHHVPRGLGKEVRRRGFLFGFTKPKPRREPCMLVRSFWKGNKAFVRLKKKNQTCGWH